MSVLLVSTWIYIRRGRRHSCQRLSCPAAYFPSRGRARWVGGRRWRTVTSSPIFQGRVFLFPLFFFLFWESELYSFFHGKVSCISLPLGMLVPKREPTPCYHDAYSVGTLNGAFLRKNWPKHCKTMVSPLFGRLFLVS